MRGLVCQIDIDGSNIYTGVNIILESVADELGKRLISTVRDRNGPEDNDGNKRMPPLQATYSQGCPALSALPGDAGMDL